LEHDGRIVPHLLAPLLAAGLASTFTATAAKDAVDRQDME